ncbi:ABC transporter substrate-binding protein [Defluviimonas sp. SAOS-178_SWC]|uniref:ABC transporter substrate-binding protein n=1 Tax=Defluviimonas sp. SAOS-178_SWC TaxID=3121287 RepID=UPI003221E4F6
MKNRLTRRKFLRTTAAAGLASPMVIGATRAHAQDSLIVGDMGGAFYEGFKLGFYDEFEKEFGISISATTMQPDPLPQYKMAVDTNTNLFDVALMTPEHVLRVQSLDGEYFEPLNLTIDNPDDFIEGNFTDHFAGVGIYAMVMGYRQDTIGENAPKSWSGFWDTEAFKGRRGLWRSPVITLETALLADGVAPQDIYPLDVDRAFAALDRIRGDIDIWWTSGAQATQLLQNGELDLMSAWSTRAYAAIASGAPVGLIWEGVYNIDGWTIPKGTPKPDLAREFIKYTMDPERQAKFTQKLALGPTNRTAYDFIDPEVAKQFPTAPGNFDNLILLNAGYWAENQDALTERFEQWILS